MYISFYEYDGQTFYFGVTSNSIITRPSLSLMEAQAELYSLEDKPGVDEKDYEPRIIQAFVRKRISRADGKIEVVDEVEGWITIVLDTIPQEFFAARVDDPAVVMPAPEGVEALAQAYQADSPQF